MKNKFLATIVDAKEFFEFMTGVLRTYVSLSIWTPSRAGRAGFSGAGRGGHSCDPTVAVR